MKTGTKKGPSFQNCICFDLVAKKKNRGPKNVQIDFIG